MDVAGFVCCYMSAVTQPTPSKGRFPGHVGTSARFSLIITHEHRGPAFVWPPMTMAFFRTLKQNCIVTWQHSKLCHTDCSRDKRPAPALYSALFPFAFFIGLHSRYLFLFTLQVHPRVLKLQAHVHIRHIRKHNLNT